ncbi:hypothetical protein SAMN04488541_101877 [Thermoflexibacter ruber]|uniref:Uncharacterized protein n=2 Tax=Thermoflexibacter ruber TaxID=1003 RepID=A0A1I2GID3_9BACT|nr:hypothetical protein SAMN04488541_101877 [Thermoflexibacter ruber]
MEVFFLIIIFILKVAMWGGLVIACFYVYDKYIRKHVLNSAEDKEKKKLDV